MTTELKGKRVLVIGASGGIGGATTDAFAASGADVLQPSREVLNVLDEKASPASLRIRHHSIMW